MKVKSLVQPNIRDYKESGFAMKDLQANSVRMFSSLLYGKFSLQMLF